MADATSTHVFARGSRVLDYWLTRAEGFTVEPIGARVEEVVVGHPSGRAQALIVRSRATRRRRAIAADRIAAVDPSRRRLELGSSGKPGRMRVAAGGAVSWTRPRAAAAARRSSAATSTALAWSRPRAAATARACAEGGRTALAWTLAAIAWLAPRIVLLTRAGLAGAARATREAAAFAARQREAIGTRWPPPPPEPPSADASTRISQAADRNAPKKLGRTQPNSPA
jgi:hypothetical protein